MKRRALHIYFWLAYLAYDTLLHYTWMGPSLPAVPEGVQLRMAVTTAFSLLPIKLLIVYYIVQVSAGKILNDEKNKFMALAELALVFGLSVVLFRAAYYYIIYPYIYHLPNTVSLFNSRSITISILEIGYVSGMAFALKFYRLQTAAREREKNLTKEKLETELKFLRNQTNPHFLFNTLNNIYALSRKKSDKTPEVVMKLSELLSFMLYESGKETISVEEELKMMQDYIDLQKIRYNERLSIEFNRKIDDGGRRIAPLLLLPLVENAFKHGISETRFDSFIHIDFELNRGSLYFCIENTIENGRSKPVNGHIGLKNIKRQLELTYKEHELEVHNKDSIFKVKILINLDSHGKI